ncbi:CCA tRNA nucleotidyltransferase [Arthrobacter sp. M4]|uniref:CCA tRNA nucleotidyltransferase n=1 Tax=Arthrobacter sp. M4 TaxID=218160 RepID=UPI001CDBB433|nr:CCA tRNA nucleotidyltransferase [Arthrobacter sp. M4]MCA4133247.1 CCA tRNA nucleotidyltransferase [Arthrobacter sp. M4]
MAQVLDSSSVNFQMDPVVLDLGQRFVDAGFELSLVGGPVRDLFLGRSSPDLDFTTNATPDQTIKIIKKWADTFWEIGRDFGTIGMRKGGLTIEITTYRAEAYDPDSRKPVVAFGSSLADDLLRRDFTINAMALRLPSMELVDPFGGIRDLHASVLSTPGTPEDSFSDDPLRMMRAARFAAQLGVDVHQDVREAMTRMAERIKIISAERVREELVKLINGAHPRIGIDLLVDTGLAEFVLPEVSALRLEADEHHRHKDVYQHSLQVLEQAVALETGPEGPVPGPDFVLRFAALMHDVGKPATRRFEPGGGVSFRHHDVVGAKLTTKRMKALRFDNDTIKAVARLVELHMRFYGYGDAGWTDSAVRRYVTDAGPLLERLHRLTRSDVTTRNQRKADRLSFAYDDLEQRIAALAEQESLNAIRPDLDGAQIMELLDLKPGPLVGRAYKFLLEERMEHGPLPHDEAVARLRAWWAQQPESVAFTNDAEPSDNGSAPSTGGPAADSPNTKES